ncbi:hypothetical protein DdX_05046 [Ditylenchus destructor]|uniref:Uncharacterized protein n=1 Tax=Ditylenchus destructor TaxID=166010 RepID=A0AAD4NDN0_9BILA|nr:hypothetical protein DdX_05046 [Ditylenchus destructor]
MAFQQRRSFAKKRVPLYGTRNIYNTPPPDTALTAGPSSTVADRPAMNERSAEKKVRLISGDTVEKVRKKVAAKHKIDSDEEYCSSDSDSSNSSQASGSSSTSSSSSSPPRSPSPQFEPTIPPVFTR